MLDLWCESGRLGSISNDNSGCAGKETERSSATAKIARDAPIQGHARLSVVPINAAYVASY